MSSAQEPCMILAAPVKMRLGGRALPSAQTLARSDTYSLLPSCSDCLLFCFSNFRFLKILLLLATSPIAKSFSSLLYVSAARTLYWVILVCRRVK